MPKTIRKHDSVIIISGSHRGKTGEVVQVMHDKDMVVVQGVNLRTKHMKPTRVSPRGGIVTKEAPLHISKVSLLDDGKPTRVRFQVRDDGTKVRVSARSGKVIPVKFWDSRTKSVQTREAL